jgi:pSer/pThr/pTyr-binding forkhead associated (FHA) protein
MQKLPDAFLIVEKGEPYSTGKALPLEKAKVLLGRASPDHQPDFAFHSPYISRRHATIEFMEGSHFLIDLPESRHGTWVNGKRLVPGQPYGIRDRDRIGLARDEVVLTFAAAASTSDETWEYLESQPGPTMAEKPDSIFILDPNRREVILDGQPLRLSGKLYDLLCLLHENQGRAVSAHEIKMNVWPERELGADSMPLVSNEEVTTLVYRLRKRLESHDHLIRTVSGYGYMLDLE